MFTSMTTSEKKRVHPAGTTHLGADVDAELVQQLRDVLEDIGVKWVHALPQLIRYLLLQPRPKRIALCTGKTLAEEEVKSLVTDILREHHAMPNTGDAHNQMDAYTQAFYAAVSTIVEQQISRDRSAARDVVRQAHEATQHGSSGDMPGQTSEGPRLRGRK